MEKIVVDKGLMQLIEKKIKNEMPVVPIEDKLELSSVLDLLKAECLARHPLVGRRYELFRTEQAAGTSLSEYINKLRDSATNAELTDLDANGLICFYALATCKDTYLSVKEDVLKLPPKELTLDKLMSLARIHESAQNALRDMSRSAASTNSTHSRGSGGGSGKKEPKKPDRMPQYLWDHILKLFAEGKCTICGKPISECPDHKKCKASFEDSNNLCSWCHGAHASAVCARKANNMKSESESTKGKGKGKNSRSNYQRNKGTDARATAYQQQHPDSYSDDNPATTSFTFFMANDAQLATNDSADDKPMQDQTIADPLSRHAVDEPTQSDKEEEEGETYCCATYSDPLLAAFKDAAAADVLYQQVKKVVQEKKDINSLPTTHPARSYKDVWDELSIDQGLLCLEGRKLIVPESLQEGVLEKSHSMHQGIGKSKAFLRNKYFFPGMNNRIEVIVRECIPCQEYMASQAAQPHIPLIASRIQEILDCDLFEAGSKHYVCLVDRFSGFLWVEKIPNQTSAAVIKFLKRVMNENGYCNILYSDSGPCFASQEMKDFASEHGIVLEKSAAHSPSTNGVAESHVGIAKRILLKSENYEAFQDGLARYRNCPRPASHGLSPSQIYFNRALREPDLAELPPELSLTPEGEKILASKLAVSEKKGGGRKELSRLEPGQKVLIQCPDSKTWRETGTVVSLDNEFERSYWIKRDGRNAKIRRNRVLLRPLQRNSSGSPQRRAAKTSHDLESSSYPASAAQEVSDTLRRSERLRARAQPNNSSKH